MTTFPWRRKTTTCRHSWSWSNVPPPELKQDSTSDGPCSTVKYRVPYVDFWIRITSDKSIDIVNYSINKLGSNSKVQLRPACTYQIYYPTMYVAWWSLITLWRLIYGHLRTQNNDIVLPKRKGSLTHCYLSPLVSGTRCIRIACSWLHVYAASGNVQAHYVYVRAQRNCMHMLISWFI